MATLEWEVQLKRCLLLLQLLLLQIDDPRGRDQLSVVERRGRGNREVRRWNRWTRRRRRMRRLRQSHYAKGRGCCCGGSHRWGDRGRGRASRGGGTSSSSRHVVLHENVNLQGLHVLEGLRALLAGQQGLGGGGAAVGGGAALGLGVGGAILLAAAGGEGAPSNLGGRPHDAAWVTEKGGGCGAGAGSGRARRLRLLRRTMLLLLLQLLEFLPPHWKGSRYFARSKRLRWLGFHFRFGRS